MQVPNPQPLVFAPLRAIAEREHDEPLAILWLGGGREQGIHEPHGHRTRFATPSHTVVCHGWSQAREQLAHIDEHLRSPAPVRKPGAGWFVALSYDMGRELEPRAAGERVPRADRAWPLLVCQRCEGSTTFDHESGAWSPAAPELSACAPITPRFHIGAVSSSSGRDAYTAHVARVLEYIRAGDVYQANLTHRLSGIFQGSTRGFFASLVRAARPWYGAYMEFDDPASSTRNAICSASPELLLAVDASSRRIVTRPMKGTRPGSARPEELFASEKDRAELTMIVDLERNDLGRVCECASVRVEQERAIERHGGHDDSGSPGVLQATATVAGTLRRDAGLLDILRAMFPGGSVTGAPKIRAMQIIDELEPVRRGLYCGAVGFIADSGDMLLNLAIRTALISGEPAPAGRSGIAPGTIDYSVGAAIVSDSTPDGEWRETLDKAAPVLGPIAVT